MYSLLQAYPKNISSHIFTEKVSFIQHKMGLLCQHEQWSQYEGLGKLSVNISEVCVLKL
jgi:hypothetical protein